jgi:chemotaxis protein methyltransferase CheR
VHEITGISLTKQKRALLSSRLCKRLRHHGLATFSQYHELLIREGPTGTERGELINCVTTNKTEFFREPHHFDFLRDTLVPELVARAKRGEPRRVRIWSAGCSTGEEPYSIAMLLADALPAVNEWDSKILASDIDTNVLERAAAGVYSERLVAAVPTGIRQASFEKCLDPPGYRVRRELRHMIKFRQINFIQERWSIRTRFDVIFCRNVTIYFDRPTQEKLYERFTRHLTPHGYLVAGHAENLHWLSHLFTPIGGTVYRVRPDVAGLKSLRPRAASIAPTSRKPGERSSHRPRRSSMRAPQGKSSATHEWLQESGLARASLQSGGIHVSTVPSVVTTVLGSCVASCLFDPVRAIGGMNHFMLPDAQEQSWVPECYGVHAMELLINQLMASGARRDRLVAKVFGAAHVVPGSTMGRKVAEANSAFVKAFLAREGIAILGERLGGESPLHVSFFTHTGKVLLRTIRDRQAEVVESERQYREELSRSSERPPEQAVTLF